MSSSGAGNVIHSTGPAAARNEPRIVEGKKREGPLAGPLNNSASRRRFRPPRPTGLPLRGCPLFVEPLGRGFDLVALRARCKEELMGWREAMQEEAPQQFLAICSKSSACDPDGVFAAVVRPSVEPAVARFDPEPCFCKQCVPPFRLEPPQLHRRIAARSPHRERKRLLFHVPVRALVDTRLALDPTSIRLVDVVLRRLEHVEDETSVRPQE